MHSAPDLVVRAHWNGAVARSTAVANCWEIVRATNRRMMPSNNAYHAPRWLLQCCQSSDTHHIHNLIRHHCSGEVLRQPQSALCPPHSLKAYVSDQSSCLKVPRLRPAWPPSSSSRISCGPDRTMLLLAERGGLTRLPRHRRPLRWILEGLQCGIRSWRQRRSLQSIAPSNCTSASARSVRRWWSCLRPRLRLGLPTHDFNKRWANRPSAKSANRSINGLFGLWPKSRGNKNCFHALVAARSSWLHVL